MQTEEAVRKELEYMQDACRDAHRKAERWRKLGDLHNDQAKAWWEVGREYAHKAAILEWVLMEDRTVGAPHRKFVSEPD